MDTVVRDRRTTRLAVALSGMRSHAAAWSLALGLALAAGACNSGDAREWTPQDHDNAKQPVGAQTSGVTDDENATLVNVTWRQNCARCHGPDGRGQVPEGRMLRAPDLTRPAVRSMSDEELAATITKGRNKMPAFSTLPPRVVELLVAHIRSLSSG